MVVVMVEVVILVVVNSCVGIHLAAHSANRQRSFQ